MIENVLIHVLSVFAIESELRYALENKKCSDSVIEDAVELWHTYNA